MDRIGREMREDDCTYQRTGEKVCLCTAYIKMPASAIRLCLIIRNSDWFVALFTPVVIGPRNYYGNQIFANQSRLSRAALHDAEVGKTMNVHVNSCRKSC